MNSPTEGNTRAAFFAWHMPTTRATLLSHLLALILGVWLCFTYITTTTRESEVKLYQTRLVCAFKVPPRNFRAAADSVYQVFAECAVGVRPDTLIVRKAPDNTNVLTND